MRIVFWVLCVAILSACATPQLPITKESKILADKLQQHNQGLKSWDLVGRASVVTGQSAYYFNVFWLQNNQHYNVRFDAALMSGTIEIRGHEGFAELKLGKEKVIKGSDPEQLLAQVTPLKIPVSGLHSWIRGVPHNKSQHYVSIMANGQTKEINQDDWLIEYTEWDTQLLQSQEYLLPSDMLLKRGDIEIRIRPAQWQQKKAPKINPLFSDLDF